MENVFKRVFYNIAGLPLIHYLGRPWRGRACVLCYHRVLPDEEFVADKSPNSNLIMPTSKFAEQMKFLSEKYKVVSMDELEKHLESDSNKFVVSITFDDGYKDNLVHALPILEKYNIPVTIYVITRLPDGDTWIWWYEIWDHLEKNNSVKANDMLKYTTIKTNKQKIKTFKILLNLILNLPYDEQRKTVENITGISSRKQYPQLCLSWDEIKKLDRHSLITIGAHTHSHPNLKQLTEEETFSEMMQSKNKLEDQLGHSVDHFAYPFGTENEADKKEFLLASRCRFRTAVTTRPQTIIRQTALNSINRLGMPSYMTPRCLRGKLSGWEQFIRNILNGYLNNSSLQDQN